MAELQPLLEVLHERHGVEYAVHGVRCQALADLVADMLAVKEAYDDGLPIGQLNLSHASGPLAQMAGVLPSLRLDAGLDEGSALDAISFGTLVRTLQQAASLEHKWSVQGCTPLHAFLCAAASQGHVCTLQLAFLLLDTSAAKEIAMGRGGDAPLHAAAERGRAEAVELLLALAPGSLGALDASKQTALHRATASGHPEMVEVLLKEGAAEGGLLSRRDDMGCLPIHLALQAGSIATLQLLLDAAPGAACVADGDGSLPIHLAAASGCRETVALVLHAAPHTAAARDACGKTPLHHAAAAGCVGTLQDLLIVADRGQVWAADEHGSLAIHCAAAAEQGSPAEAVAALLEAAPDSWEAVDASGCTPLAVAAMLGHAEAVEELLDACRLDASSLWEAVAGSRAASGSMSARGDPARTPLALAAAGGHAAVVQLLLSRCGCWAGQDAGVYDALSSPLHLAARLGHVAVLELLLEAVEDVAVWDEGGPSVLEAALEGRHVAAVEAVLKAAPQLADRETEAGSTPLHAAVVAGFVAVLPALLAAAPDALFEADGDGNTPLHLAAAAGLCPAVEPLLSAAPGAALVEDNSGRLPLHVAAGGAGGKPAEVVSLLLRAEPSAASIGDDSGQMPLHAAAAAGNAGPAQLLLAACPHMARAETADGLTPLHLAVRAKHLGVVQVLVAAQPRLVAVPAGSSALTPLHDAAVAGDAEIVRLLAAALPAALLQSTRDGGLPLHLAAKHGHADAVEVLLAIAPGGAASAAAETDYAGQTAVHCAAAAGQADVVRVLLAAAPAMAWVAAEAGWLPIHCWASRSGHLGTLRALLAPAPGSAIVQDSQGLTPLHTLVYVACRPPSATHTQLSSAVVMESGGYLLQLAPAAALLHSSTGRTPLHLAAEWGGVDLIPWLLAAAPQAAGMEDHRERTPLDLALRVGQTETARKLLRAGNGGDVLASLVLASMRPGGQAAQALYADFVCAWLPLSANTWAMMPPGRPGLVAALPSAYAHSEQQASQLVCKMHPSDVARLRSALLCLARAQRRRHVTLPAPLVHRIVLLACC